MLGRRDVLATGMAALMMPSAHAQNSRFMCLPKRRAMQGLS